MRIAFVGAGLLALLALAAVGSTGEWGGGPGEVRGVPAAFVDYAFTIAVLGLVALAVLVYDAFRNAPGRPMRLPERGVSPLTAFLFFSAVIALYVAIRGRQERPAEQGAEPGQMERRRGSSSSDGAAGADGVDFQWWLAIAVALLVAGYLLYARSRRPASRPPAAQQLEAVLTETLAEFELDPDPRRAVIQAYVRMERVLDEHGYGRQPHEAPLEYLARVLRELDVRAEAAHALTELFERARFSTHEIDAAMRAEAVASLEAVRDDLREAA